MSLWMFILLCIVALYLLNKGSNHIKYGENAFEAFIGVILFLVGLSAAGYGIYKYFIFDYSSLIEEAVVNHDYAKAHDLLFEMGQISSETSTIGFFSEKKSKYSIAYEKVIKSEITYLLNQGDKESSDRLISIVGDLPIEATPTIGITDNLETQKKNEDYSIYVGKFNGLCDDVLHNAISTGNRYLAERILTLYKPTLIRTLEESHIFRTDAYRYSYSNEMQNAARERFNEAVRMKVFQ